MIYIKIISPLFPLTFSTDSTVSTEVNNFIFLILKAFQNAAFSICFLGSAFAVFLRRIQVLWESQRLRAKNSNSGVARILEEKKNLYSQPPLLPSWNLSKPDLCCVFSWEQLFCCTAMHPCSSPLIFPKRSLLTRSFHSSIPSPIVPFIKISWLCFHSIPFITHKFIL